MRLSTKSQYACLALIDLAERESDRFVKTEDIARRKKIPRRFLEQILMQLKQSRIVKSKKGPDGGFKLGVPADNLTLAEVIRLMDGALAPVTSVSVHFYEPTPTEQNAALTKVLRGIRDYISRTLESTTFADLTRRK